MEITSNKTVFVLLFATLIVSGCTGGGNEEETSSTAAIQVNEFSAFPNPTPGNQNTRFRMQVENVGDHDAENVSAFLFNPPFADSSSDDNSWRDDSDDPGEVTDSDRTLEFSDMDAPGDTPSTPSTQTVTFTSPDLSDGRNNDYTMRSQLFYKYGTDAATEIRVMGDDAYREAGSPQGTATIDNDNGPVQMEVRTPTPIPIYEDGVDNVEKELCVVVRNQGSGVPFADEDGSAFDGGGYDRDVVSEHTNNVKLSIENVGRLSFRTDNDGDFSEDVSSQTVEIIGGRAVSCWDMQVDVGGSTLDTTVPLVIESTYFYRQEESTVVTVQGRQ